MTVPIRFINSGYGRTNITAATILGTSSSDDMRLVSKVMVIVTGVTDSSVLDSASSTTPSAANTILVIPAGTTPGTIYDMEYPCAAGVGIVPGSGATLAVVWQ